MRYIPLKAIAVVYIPLVICSCSKRINDKVGLTKETQGLPQGWVWALGKNHSIALPATTKIVQEAPYPHATHYSNRSDFNASYWNEEGKLIGYSVISCKLREPIDSIQHAIYTAKELDQGLTDSSPLVRLQEKNVTIDGKQGYEFWQRTQTLEENFKAFLDQSPNDEVRKSREEGRPKKDNSLSVEKYHACVLLKDKNHIYLLVVKGTSGLKITDPIVRPFFDHFKVN